MHFNNDFTSHSHRGRRLIATLPSPCYLHQGPVLSGPTVGVWRITLQRTCSTCSYRALMKTCIFCRWSLFLVQGSMKTGNEETAGLTLGLPAPLKLTNTSYLVRLICTKTISHFTMGAVPDTVTLDPFTNIQFHRSKWRICLTAFVALMRLLRTHCRTVYIGLNVCVFMVIPVHHCGSLMCF